MKYIYQKKGGVSNARNNGIKNSNGDWVAFLESDDEWMLNKLAKQVLFLENHRELSFCHTNEIWVRNGVRINQMKKHKKFGGKIFEKCLDICRISPSSVLIKKTDFNIYWNKVYEPDFIKFDEYLFKIFKNKNIYHK